MYRDLRELLFALNAHKVRYMVVGGYAVGVHAQPRVTKDLDIFIARDRTNAEAVYKALSAFGAPMERVQVDDFERPDSVFRIGTPPVCIDILQYIDGVTFEEAWESSAEHLVVTGLSARYISAELLVKNKLAAGRPQDLADVTAIRQARAAKARGATE